jgi:ubiquinone/menaquinone biosynthesis C-methylase UbiE
MMRALSNQDNNSNEETQRSQADEVLREWRENAFYWQKHRATIQTMFQPITQALIEDAGIVEGQSILDVAGGSGEPSFTIAKSVGPNGSVMFTDLVAGMVDGAQSEAQRRGLANIKFRQCAADSLPFENDSFDAVTSRLGAMFFPDPLAAMREMLRVTKPSGVLALAVWAKSELNPFFCLVTEVLERHVPTATPPDPNAPGAFRFAEPDTLARILRQAGATKVKERQVEFHITAPMSPEEFWEMRSETSGTLREKLVPLSPQKRNLIAQEIHEATRKFFLNNQMSFPAQVIVVTGSKA